MVRPGRPLGVPAVYPGAFGYRPAHRVGLSPPFFPSLDPSQHALASKGDLRVSVLVNEWGSHDVDSLILDATRLSAAALGTPIAPGHAAGGTPFPGAPVAYLLTRGGKALGVAPGIPQHWCTQAVMTVIAEVTEMVVRCATSARSAAMPKPHPPIPDPCPIDTVQCCALLCSARYCAVVLVRAGPVLCAHWCAVVCLGCASAAHSFPGQAHVPRDAAVLCCGLSPTVCPRCACAFPL